MVAGTLLLLAASIFQVLRVDVFSAVSGDGLYYLISMAGVVFMYWGGQRLKVT